MNIYHNMKLIYCYRKHFFICHCELYKRLKLFFKNMSSHVFCSFMSQSRFHTILAYFLSLTRSSGGNGTILCSLVFVCTNCTVIFLTKENEKSPHCSTQDITVFEPSLLLSIKLAYYIIFQNHRLCGL